MRLLFEMAIAMGGMGLTTVGTILVIEQRQPWPIPLILVGIPLLWYSAEFIDADD